VSQASPETQIRQVVDLTRDLREATRHGASMEQIDELVGEGLEALRTIIPHDLATVMELQDDTLSVRVARGILARPEVQEHQLSLADFPSLREVIERGRTRAFSAHDHSDGDGDTFDGVLDLEAGHSCMVAPIRVRDEIFGLLTLDRTECGMYPPEEVQLADVFAKLMAMVLSYGEQSARLGRLHRQMEEQNRLLTEHAGGRAEACRRIEACTSAPMQRVQELARQVAATTAPVLITGETGTGKEVLASAIHGWSARSAGPFVPINCAALPGSLIESELFGHVKGAFTGATKGRIGRFQTANGGTLFLDELGELPLELQAKLLRVLQEGCFESVGSDHTVRVDVRIVAATNRDLEELLAAKAFREDLYYRLMVFPIHLPPLRERPEDIVVIAKSYLEELSRRTGRGPWELSDRNIAALGGRHWRGNVRELVNTLERATIVASGAQPNLVETQGREAPSSGTPSSSVWLTLREMERKHISDALRRADGKVHGAGGAAELLDINPSTLRSRMAKLKLK